MKQIASNHPDRLSFRSASGAGLILGLVFLVMGGVIAFVEVPIEGGEPWTLQAVGAGFALIGLGCIVLRGGTTIDRESNLLTRWIGIPFPLHKTTTLFEAIGVRLRCELHRRKGHRFYTYPIDLITPNGDVPLGQADQVMQGFNAAQAVSLFLDVELVDESQDQVDQGLIPTIMRAVTGRRG